MSYLHGYSLEESERLRHQAQHLRPYVHDGKALGQPKQILEIGAGVCAQTAILVEDYPTACVTAVERDLSSHREAVAWVESQPHLARRVFPVHANAEALPPGLTQHDAAFICWVLEHAANPLQLLLEVRRALARGARVVVHEVLNQSWLLRPEFPSVVAQYWAAVNALQRRIGGDPDIGARLGQLLHDAGYQSIHTSGVLIQLDDRRPDQRVAMFDYMADLLSSSRPSLADAGDPAAALADEAAATLRRIGRTPGSTFHYVILRAIAQAP